MYKEFVNYKQAVALKELGFNASCLGYYNSDPGLKKPSFNLTEPFEHEWCIPAPLKQQALRWFGDKYRYFVMISDTEIAAANQLGYRWRWAIFKPMVDEAICVDSSILGFLDYEDAESDSIDKLIELAKQNNNK